VKSLSRAPLTYALQLAEAISLWLSTFFLINQLNINFTVLLRGKGQVKYDVGLNLISPDVDYALWLISVEFVALYFLKSSIPNIAKDTRSKVKAALLLSALASSFFAGPLAARSISILAVAVIIFDSYFGNRGTVKPDRISFRTLLSLILAIPLTVTFLAAVRWVLNGFDGFQSFSDISWGVALLDLKMNSMLNPILPRLFILFSAAWVLRLLIPVEHILKKLKTRHINLKPSLDSSTSKSGRPVKIILISALVTAVFIGVYPYLPALNPSSQLVSVDVGFYYKILKDSANLDPVTFLSNIVKQDRMLYLALQQTVATVTGSPDLTIRVMPAILAALLTLSVYTLISTGLKDRSLAASAALFTATSFQVVAGINAGFYANWLALIELNIFFALILKAGETGKDKHSTLAIVTSVVILFTHSATWTVLMASLLTYLAITYVRRTITHRDAKLIIQIILVNIASELIKSNLLLSRSTAGVTQSITPNISISNISAIFGTLNTTFTYFLGGAFANPVILITAAIGLFYIATSKEKLHQILIALVTVCTLGTFFTGTTPDLLQSRFIYLIPFQILTAIGVKTLTNIYKHNSNTTTILGKTVPTMIYLIIFATLLSYSLRVAGYIYTMQ